LFAQASLDLGVLAPALDKIRLTGGYRYTWDTIKGSVDYHTPFPGGQILQQHEPGGSRR
jgi:iron complex outermembrane receptor protein